MKAKRTKLKVTGAAMAHATRGRARTFENRKKEQNRKACRRKVLTSERD